LRRSRTQVRRTAFSLRRCRLVEEDEEALEVSTERGPDERRAFEQRAQADPLQLEPVDRSEE
jgi:hypothetical protein